MGVVTLRRPDLQRSGLVAPWLKRAGDSLDEYAQRVIRTRPANLIAYWPLSEASGASALDLSGNGRNGAYTGVDLGQPGIGDGHSSPLFDGVNDVVNVYGASLAAAFNGAEGSVLLPLKVSSSNVWSDSTVRGLFLFNADANNGVQAYKDNTADGTIRCVQKAGGTSKTLDILHVANTGWMFLAFSWSKAADQWKVFLDSVQQGSTITGLGVWAGSLTEALIGARSTSPSSVWSGTLAHCALWNVALTQPEIAALSRL